ncbi:MAG TPA: bifunctional DNA-formamidopyrimidine glycosylase/DNA-(apurinic or apyrimidinic site) lyase [Anaerolineaceae bacterium]|nr:bifunctional DNA-formamidopyrimidine glycosylase/DNA-(apurinic or apyrimidinic site) lyase [Anaerolineaceae bacterium]HQJ32222.1 bifunctional DNA-formamidopyrimidine glycosylase/DNA-(apurinic or apyrimidinic site) lyase [Anaerolineaceae bacterium]
MPELPEVETIARNLRRGTDGASSLIGQTILSARLLWPRTLAEPDMETFQALLPGQSVQDIGRRAKFLTITLSESILVFHLRMSGDLRMEPSESPLEKHDRMVLDFTSGWRLSFNDTRKFGRVWLVYDTLAIFAALGPEPDDPALTPAKFHEMLRERKRAIKPLLLDQHFLAGLGNIYTDEALFRASIHPLQSSETLDEQDAARLLEAIRFTLASGIESNGASIDWVYRGGDFQNHFQVYQRSGKPCPRCGQPINKILVGQRGTHFCPNCQKLKGA